MKLDYRNLVKVLDHQKLEYHTFQLPSEKLLHIPEPIGTEDIKKNLVSKGYHPENITRMRSKETKSSLHMVLVTLPKFEKHVYQLTEVLSLIVKVEEQLNNARIGQCHRCQRFGHS